MSRPFKIVVTFERREDGGLRAWSPDLPGFVLSNRNPDAVLADVEPALKTILGFRLRAALNVEPLDSLREALEDDGVVDGKPMTGEREYVAYCA
jgi:hypothetical protein